MLLAGVDLSEILRLVEAEVRATQKKEKEEEKKEKGKIPKAPTYPNTQPILVFLHAGTWMAGGGGSDGLLQPDYLLENDVMVITINHRLGPFGFLSTGDGESPGNYGLMDQVRALEWVRDNARYFGGMNDSVTIMGSGAGGSSVHLLILSPWTRGASIYQDEYCLMHRAISHSGTAYSPHAIVRNPKTHAVRLGVQVGCGTPGDTKALMACLRSLPAFTINDNIPALYEWDDEPPPFGAVIDSWQGDEAFLPDEPHHLIRHRQFLQVPWLMGTNKDDGAFRVQDILQDSSLTTSLNKDWDKFGPLLLDLKDTSCKDPKEMARDIRKYYMGSKKFGHESTIEFVEMMTDRFFLYPTEHAANDHCYYIKGQLCYRYQLVYSGRKSFLDMLNKETPYHQTSSLLGGRGASNPRFQNTRDAQGWGVSFLDELLFLFPSPRLGLVYKQDFNADSASRISTHMIMLWTNFIKGSDPTPQLDGWPDDVSPWGAWWEPYYPNYNFWLQIDPEMESREEPLRGPQMSFWGDLPLYENRDNNVIRDEL
ncbi:hypothetical protein Pcinc_030274 [Petrolisthes cinctipes]|uniref:Carboxylesterase type B domain-containing protein n=1 Tax=Petrolisthes cinctipes TaxID=88211 RepID=A0AAE1EYR2_PETCI|nr:hypothetical protein Pcinc_030274 [Petrolisthes cinctipes]